MKILIILILIAHTTLLANTLTEKEISEWKSIGVEKMFIGNWKSQGIKTPRDAKRWIDAGETRGTDFSALAETFKTVWGGEGQGRGT